MLRVPDAETAIALTADQLGKAEFDSASGGPHRMLASLSASAIALSKKFLPESDGEAGLLKRLGAQTVVAATVFLFSFFVIIVNTMTGVRGTERSLVDIALDEKVMEKDKLLKVLDPLPMTKGGVQ